VAEESSLVPFWLALKKGSFKLKGSLFFRPLSSFRCEAERIKRTISAEAFRRPSPLLSSPLLHFLPPLHFFRLLS